MLYRRDVSALCTSGEKSHTVRCTASRRVLRAASLIRDDICHLPIVNYDGNVSRSMINTWRMSMYFMVTL